MADEFVSQTLREIAAEKASKRPQLVDWLLEDAPILDMLKWIPATHGLWNVDEVLSDVQGAQFVDLDAPLPEMSVSTGLQTHWVSVMGGYMTVGEDKADQFGGKERYFAKREPKVIRKSGMDTERAIFNDFWRKAALKNAIKLGGTGNNLSTILIVRFDDSMNTGIYDPTQFNSGRLLNWKSINGGNLYGIRSDKDGKQVLGYGVRAKGRFGWQLMEPDRVVKAIVNVDKDNMPTIGQIYDAIDDVRGKPSNTFIFGNSRVLRQVFSKIKEDKVQYANSDSSIKTLIGDIDGFRIVGSHNVSDRNEKAVS